MRHYRVGVPITMFQYEKLTAEVVVDRLLARRLYPLAAAISDWLGLPPKMGRSRVLAHWACYKVTARHSDEDDKSVANAIRQKLGNHPQISYCDIAAKAAEGGKKDLAELKGLNNLALMDSDNWDKTAHAKSYISDTQL